MKKNFTLLIAISNLENDECEMLDFDTLLDQNFSDFEDVLQLLSKTEFEPNKNVVNNIVNFSRSITT